ncbi:MAG: TetR/AcrR family transcriptional regulator [Gammaproteobacteria bacterium]|nr:TetR/AcrR family transcriptional regulator [Gammaproteobacteria bacterium]
MSIGRPLEFDPEQALDSALAVFWSQGYEAASLQDLLQSMGLSKSSFYQAFQSKHALFERCLERYRDQVTGQLTEGLRGAGSGLAFIEGVLRSIVAEAHNKKKTRGCLIMNTANEFSQSDPKVARRVTSGLTSFRKVFLKAVQQAQQAGEIDDKQDPQVLADYLVTSISGLRTMVKAGASAATVEGVIDVTMKALR